MQLSVFSLLIIFYTQVIIAQLSSSGAECDQLVLPGDTQDCISTASKMMTSSASINVQTATKDLCNDSNCKTALIDAEMDGFNCIIPGSNIFFQVIVNEYKKTCLNVESTIKMPAGSSNTTLSGSINTTIPQIPTKATTSDKITITNNATKSNIPENASETDSSVDLKNNESSDATSNTPFIALFYIALTFCL